MEGARSRSEGRRRSGARNGIEGRGRGSGERARGDRSSSRSRRRQGDEEPPVHSRDSIVLAYDAASASRARNARVRTQERSKERASRPERRPLTSEESRYQVERSREAYERARENRRAEVTIGRNGTRREVIDGRGSIDSRAFNERNELVGYTIDRSDRHEPMLDLPANRSRWGSSAGRGMADGGDVGGAQRSRNQDLRKLSDTISGRSDFQGNNGGSAVPMSIKVLGALVVVLLVILIVILVI